MLGYVVPLHFEFDECGEMDRKRIHGMHPDSADG
jgi:hypothetical protein